MAMVELGELRAALRGRVLTPADRDYDTARAAWNKNIDQRPSVVVRPHGADDIAAAVRQARRWSMAVAVQGTGHGAVLPCDGAMLLDTSALTAVRIDAGRRVARVEPGATWGPVMRAAGSHGLAGRAGFNSTVGVLGYTLGGGYGWLSRRYGLAADHVTAADVVLADGSAVRVDADTRPELLWALRGGCGHFGVVTALEFGVVPVGTAFGGTLTFPLDRARDVLRRFAGTTRGADPRLTVAVRLFRVPTDGWLAGLFAGRPAVSVMICFLGEQTQGEALTRHWLDAGPAHGGLGRIGTGDLGAIDGPPPKGAKSVQAGEQLARLDEATIETLVSRFEPDDAPVFLTEVRHVGGAVRTSADVALDRREGEYLLHLESAAETDEQRAAAVQWLDGTRGRIGPALTGSAALGFTGDGERGMAAARRAFSAAHRERLLAVKRRLDPDDRFRFNVGAAFKAGG